jgi:hypothetical protein
MVRYFAFLELFRVPQELVSTYSCGFSASQDGVPPRVYRQKPQSPRIRR